MTPFLAYDLGVEGVTIIKKTGSPRRKALRRGKRGTNRHEHVGGEKEGTDPDTCSGKVKPANSKGARIRRLRYSAFS